MKSMAIELFCLGKNNTPDLMRKFILLFFTSAIYISAQAQDSWTIDAGLSGPWAVSTGKFSEAVETQKHPLPIITGRFQWKIGTRFRLGTGAGISMTKFSTSFVLSHDDASINYQNACLNLMPMIGIALGKHRTTELNFIPTFGIPFIVKEDVQSRVYTGTGSEYTHTDGNMTSPQKIG
ncbi:hypothetical protein, partial [Taibaiella soli]